MASPAPNIASQVTPLARPEPGCILDIPYEANAMRITGSCQRRT
ncbi:hypothetical protein [Candidatus Oscillochloris fontis]|nr:hypothetical protein [Candidatus Oscillochloris fontis]